tara:strand:+ start:45 stop:446 length:402 start_codon:yes stop_codon:yes gene_type:complete
MRYPTLEGIKRRSSTCETSVFQPSQVAGFFYAWLKINLDKYLQACYNIHIKNNNKNFRRRSDMNLTFLTLTDKALHAMRNQQDSDGREARREIQRRKLVGFCDGTNITTVDAKAVVETQSRVGTITTYTKGSR